MNKVELAFLNILKAALKGSVPESCQQLSADEWTALFALADQQHVLPLIYEAVYSLDEIRVMDQVELAAVKKAMIRQVMVQVSRTEAFLDLYQKITAQGLRPLVVKGILCRNIYPKPDDRISADEDMLIKPEDFLHCHEIMTAENMIAQEEEITEKHEIPYRQAGGSLYIEMHKYLFSPGSDAYGYLNRYFADVSERAVGEVIHGVTVYTMDYTDHLFYLICHAYKHFIHSGFGIRQISDIVMFANHYGKKIRWQKIVSQCEEVHAAQFAKSVFEIGRKYLILDDEKACFPDVWKKDIADETFLLEDCLGGGVYGAADMNRLHSSTMTLNAVTADQEGKSVKGSIAGSVFLPLDSMAGKYPYLKKYPYLLPAAWIQRVFRYLKEKENTEGESARQSLDTGRARIELLKKYGIIGK